MEVLCSTNYDQMVDCLGRWDFFVWVLDITDCFGCFVGSFADFFGFFIYDK